MPIHVKKVGAVVVVMAPADKTRVGAVGILTCRHSHGLVVAALGADTSDPTGSIAKSIRTGLGIKCRGCSRGFAAIKNHDHFTGAGYLGYSVGVKSVCTANTGSRSRRVGPEQGPM